LSGVKIGSAAGRFFPPAACPIFAPAICPAAGGPSCAVRAGRYVWAGSRAAGRGLFHWKLGAKKTGAQWPPLVENVGQLFRPFGRRIERVLRFFLAGWFVEQIRLSITAIFFDKKPDLITQQWMFIESDAEKLKFSKLKHFYISIVKFCDNIG
jgi:hypothetical protein